MLSLSSLTIITKWNSKKVISEGFYQLCIIRDGYRNKYEQGLIQESNYISNISNYLNIFLVLIHPICPHFVETIWNYADRKGIIMMNTWPKAAEQDVKLLYYRDIITGIIDNCRGNIVGQVRRNTKKATDATATPAIAKYRITR